MADDPPTRDVKEFQFQQMCKVQVAARQTDSVPKHRSQLLAVSNKYGLTFVGVQEGFKVIKTIDLINADANESDKNKVVTDLPMWTVVSTESAPTHLALSNDDMTLAVCVEREGLPLVLLYDIRVFAEKDSKPRTFHTIPLYTSPSVRLVDFVWNPGTDFPAVFAAVMSDGSLKLMEATENLKIMGSLKAGSGVTAVCWSPKGKQIVVGKKDGTMQQYDQELKLKKNIAAPTIFQDPMKVLDIQWLTTFTFQVAYMPQGDAITEQPSLVFVHAPKTGNLVFTNYEDVCFGQGEDREPVYYLHHIIKWGVMTVASANATECGILGKKADNQECWELWTLEDSGRAQLPTTEDYDDTYPVGVAIDYTSQRQIPLGEDKFHPPAPVYMLLNTDGQLLLFYMMNYFPGAEQLTCPPQVLTSAGARIGKGEEQAIPKQPAAVAPSTTSAAPAKTSLFGKPGGGFSFSAAPTSGGSGGFDLAKPLGQATAMSVPKPSQGAATTSALGATKFTFGAGTTGAPSGGLFGSTAGLPSSGSGFTLGFGTTGQQPPKSVPPANTIMSAAPVATTAPLTSLFSMKGAPPSYTSSLAVKSTPGAAMFGGSRPLTGDQTDATSAGFGVPQQVSSSSDPPGLFSQPKPVTTQPFGQPSTGQLSGILAGQSKLPQVTIATTQPQQQQLRPTMTSLPQQPASSISKPIAVSHPVQVSTTVAQPVSSASRDPQPHGIGSVSHPSPETTGMPSGGKISANQTVESTFTRSIVEEMSHFEKEMQDLKSRSSQCQYKVGTKEELSKLRKDTESVELFIKEIKTVTQASNSEIHSLKSDVLEAFTQLEECHVRQQRNMEPRYQQLLKSRALDPMSTAKMKQLRAVTQNIEKTLNDANFKLDEEWENQQDKKAKGRQMQAPSTDTIYRTLSNNHNLILSMTKRIESLVTDLKAMKLHNLTASWENRSFSIPEEKSDLEHQELASLADSLLETRLSPKKPPVKSLSPEKQSRLRQLLGRRAVTPVKVTAPANLSMSKIVSAQDLRRVLSKRFEEDSFIEEKPRDTVTELKAAAKVKESPGINEEEKIPSTTQVVLASMTARKGLFTSPASTSTPSRPLTFGTGPVPPSGGMFGGAKMAESPGPALGNLMSAAPAKPTTTTVTVLSGTKPADTGLWPTFGSMFNPGAAGTIKFGTDSTFSRGPPANEPFQEPQVEDLTPESTSESGDEEEEEDRVEDLAEEDNQAGEFAFWKAMQSSSEKPPVKSEAKPTSGFSFSAPPPTTVSSSGKSTAASTSTTTATVSPSVSSGAAAPTRTTLFGGTGYVLGSKPAATVTTAKTTSATTASVFSGSGGKPSEGSTTSVSQGLVGKPEAANSSPKVSVSGDAGAEQGEGGATSVTFGQSLNGKPIVPTSSVQVEESSPVVSKVETVTTTTSSAFGSGFSLATGTSAPSGGFSFGGSNFGGTATTSSSVAGGAAGSAAPATSGVGLFGKSTASSGFGFAFTQPTTGASVFGGSSTVTATTAPATTTAASAPLGTVATTATAETTTAVTTTAATSSLSGGTSTSTTTTATSLFSGGGAGTGLFGQATTSGATGFTALGRGGTSLFGGQGQPATSNTEAAAATTTITTTTTTTTAPTAATSTTSLFGGIQTTTSSTGVSIFGTQPLASTSSVFGGTQPSTITSSVFGGTQPSTTTSSGFGGAQPSATTSSVFGGTQPSATASSGFGGTQPSATTSSVFGGTQPSATTSSVFGGTQPSATTSSVFGGTQPSATTSSVFGGTQPSATTSSVFGGTQPSATTSSVFGGTQPSATTSSVFGGTQPSATTSSVFGGTQPSATTSSVFGGTQPSATTSSVFGGTQPSATTSSVFGGTQPSATTSSVFGGTQPSATTSSVFGGTQPSATTSSVFGGTQPSATTSSVFGGTQPSATTSSVFGGTQPSATTSSVFGGTQPSATTSSVFGGTQPSATTSSVFGGTQPSATTSSVFGGTQPSATTSSVFGGTQPSATTSSVFGGTQPSATTSSVFGGSQPSATTSSVFGGTQHLATTSVFGGTQVSATTASVFGGAQPTSSTSTTPLFGGEQSATTATTGTTLFGNSQVSSSTATPPLFGSTPTASTATSAPLFGSAQPSTTSTGAASIFGGGSTVTSGGTFGSSGGTSVFGVQPSTTGGSAFGSSTFGQSGTGLFGQQQTSTATSGTGTGPFGTPSASEAPGGLFGGGGGLFGGLGGKPSKENASKNVFGGTGFQAAPASQGSSLFGSSGTTTTSPFGSPAPSVFGAGTSGGGGGAFSSGSGGVAQTGFGGFSQQQQQNKPPGGFGASPTFGGAASFGGRPAFGSPPAFGSSSVFGGGATFSSPVGGSTFGSSQTAQGGGFAAFANAGSSPTFGALAQGGNTPSFGSAAQSQAAPTFGGFGSPQGQQQTSPNFSGWR
ncbi:nuclear pore complex protein Nup214 isoform X2 [Lingula anatina]|uniref:Nuclear pore complex protein Nup214 n=1 Tax=Lingula anatina TaxID=7574 RepID=A0A1S3KCA1_LINAN|nr:nuclear pore complex protein Nup214 isoform X2 [Lingula anatina]|eukprot:XP_013420263.1 nuclear pore complex protein Nup214 isoform X2 [Lingula anatina]